MNLCNRCKKKKSIIYTMDKFTEQGIDMNLCKSCGEFLIKIFGGRIK